MKTNRIVMLTILLTVINLSVFAQFKVYSDGNMSMGNWTSATGTKLNIQTAAGQAAIWVKKNSAADGEDAIKVTTYRNNDHVYSIYNQASGSNTKTYTVTGDGKVRATSYLNYSDSILKYDIQKVNSIANKLFKLEGVSYFHKSDAKAERPPRVYGFIAQDVEKVFPELVHEDGDGLKAVSYVEMIPLLIEALKEKSQLIEQLNTRVAELEYNTQSIELRQSFTDNSSIDNMEAELYQNTPNPFTHTTQIKYSLPVTAVKATIYIYNMQGTQISEHPLDKNSDYLSISGGKLQPGPGMYLYSLIVDGKIVDTKKMILTNN